MPMRRGTRALGPSPEAREAARARRAEGAISRAARSQGMEAREPMPPRTTGRKKGGKIMKKSDKAGRALVRKSADTMGRAMMAKGGMTKKYAKGGSIDGCATKGKTKGKMVTMARGGMTSGCK